MFEIRSIIEFDESEFFGISDTLDSSFEEEFFVQKRFVICRRGRQVCKDVRDASLFHYVEGNG